MQKELYDLDDVSSQLKGTNYIKISKHLNLVAVVPTGINNTVAVVRNSLLTIGNGFSRRRVELQKMMPGCDIYYEISPVPETAKLRRTLALSKVSVDANDKGIGNILDKKYFILSLEELSKDEVKKLRDLKIDLSHNMAIFEENGNYHIKYVPEKHVNVARERTGKAISALDLKKINDAGLGYLIDSGALEIFVQNGVTFQKTTLEALDTTVEYMPKDDVTVSPYRKEADEIVAFYVYDAIFDERPGLGNAYELEKRTVSEEGELLWTMSPKIIQNDNNIQYAIRAMEKGILTAERLPKDSSKIIAKLTEEGKLDKIKEFRVKKINGKTYLVESGITKDVEPTTFTA